MLNGVFCDFPPPTGDEENEMVQKSKITEMDEKKEVVDCGKKSDNKKPTLKNELTGKQGQEVKAEDDTLAEPASGKEGEQSTKERELEGQKREETKPVSDK